MGSRSSEGLPGRCLVADELRVTRLLRDRGLPGFGSRNLLCLLALRGTTLVAGVGLLLLRVLAVVLRGGLRILLRIRRVPRLLLIGLTRLDQQSADCGSGL